MSVVLVTMQINIYVSGLPISAFVNKGKGNEEDDKYQGMTGDMVRM